MRAARPRTVTRNRPTPCPLARTSLPSRPSGARARTLDRPRTQAVGSSGTSRRCRSPRPRSRRPRALGSVTSPSAAQSGQRTHAARALRLSCRRRPAYEAMPRDPRAGIWRMVPLADRVDWPTTSWWDAPRRPTERPGIRWSPDAWPGTMRVAYPAPRNCESASRALLAQSRIERRRLGATSSSSNDVISCSPLLGAADLAGLGYRSTSERLGERKRARVRNRREGWATYARRRSGGAGPCRAPIVHGFIARANAATMLLTTSLRHRTARCARGRTREVTAARTRQ